MLNVNWYSYRSNVSGFPPSEIYIWSMKSDNMTVDLSLFFVFGQEVFLKWKKKNTEPCWCHWSASTLRQLQTTNKVRVKGEGPADLRLRWADTRRNIYVQTQNPAEFKRYFNTIWATIKTTSLSEFEMSHLAIGTLWYSVVGEKSTRLVSVFLYWPCAPRKSLTHSCVEALHGQHQQHTHTNKRKCYWHHSCAWKVHTPWGKCLSSGLNML